MALFNIFELCENSRRPGACATRAKRRFPARDEPPGEDRVQNPCAENGFHGIISYHIDEAFPQLRNRGKKGEET